MSMFLAVVLAAVVLNEVHYDPDGADTGFEFVELSAPPNEDPNASIAGWVFETGNGARPGEWTVAWTGRSGDRLHGGLFVIGEDAVEPRPDAVVELDLQNGPDACRLRGPSDETDVLGWGDPLDASFVETRAAPDAPSGSALARLPDGADTNCNECDFRAAGPTPGEFNAPAIGVVVEEAATPAPDLSPGSAVEFSWTIRNIGRAAWSGSIRLACSAHPNETLATFAPFDAAPLAAGSRARVARLVAPPPGAHLPVSDPPFPFVAAPWLGIGVDFAVTEVLPRPANDGPEWVELVVVGGEAVDLAAFGITDEAGTFASFEGIAEPGTFVVVAPDTAAFRARWHSPPGTQLVEAVPWPTLNHTASGGAAAERVRMRIGDHVLEDAAIPGGAMEDVSWERASLLRGADALPNWQSSLDSAGATPGRSNSRDGDRPLARLPDPGALAVSPRAFAPGRDGPALVVLSTRAPASSCAIELFDASGSFVHRLDAWPSGPLEHRALWDGRDSFGAAVPLGLYILRAETTSEPPARATVVLLQ